MNSAAPVAYDTISRVNHWIVALAMIGMLGVGLYLGNLEPPKETKEFLLPIHKSVGVLVLLYGVWRVFWRLSQGFPGPAANLPAWQERIAKITHYGLLFCIIFMPFSGLMGSLFDGRAVHVFSLFTIPPIAEIKLFKSAAYALHRYVSYLLVAMVVLHIAAALKHHFIDKDMTLVRMLRGMPANRSADAGRPVRS